MFGGGAWGAAGCGRLLVLQRMGLGCCSIHGVKPRQTLPRSTVIGMSEHLAALLDLQAGWQRVLRDNRIMRTFVRHPHELSLAWDNIADWHALLVDDIRSGRYAPSAMRICDVPKPGGHARPGAVLTLRDQVVYASLVHAMLPRIRGALGWSRRIDYAYRFRPQARSGEWFESRFRGWRQFGTDTLNRIANGAAYVVVADIAGYYEYIDLAVLASDLRRLGCDEEATTLLAACLNMWSQTLMSGKGIPQGHSASDVLGKVYLDQVDRRLAEQGYVHGRYVDDFRIFCDDRRESKTALLELTSSLRKRGLILQSAKSSAQPADTVRGGIEVVQHRIRDIVSRYLADMAELFEVEDPYLTVADADELLAESPDEVPLEHIESAYRTFFMEQAAPFDKTLFHFLLRRMGTGSSDFAVDHAIALIPEQPQEMGYILKYIAELNAVAEQEVEVIQQIRGAESVYWYPVYLFFEWRVSQTAPATEELLTFARMVLYEENPPWYVKSAAREIIAAYGTAADLERFEQDFAEAESDLQQAEMVCSLRRTERGRRNAFLGRITNPEPFTRFALRKVRPS